MTAKIKSLQEIAHLLPFGNELDSDNLLRSEIMSDIILEIYNGWPGRVGLERVIEKVEFIRKIVPQYAAAFGRGETETLERLAKSRRVNYCNHFQNANIPDLTDVYIFENVGEFKAKFPSGQYICPCCEGISTDYSTCNSGRNIDNNENKVVCNWKVYGLFGDLGKGIHVLIKDKIDELPRPINMFKPIELID